MVWGEKGNKMKLNKPEENGILFFEPEDHLFSRIGHLFDRSWPIHHAHNAGELEAVIGREKNAIALVIAADETEDYDTLALLEAYQNEPWFAGALTLVVAEQAHPGRREKAEGMGVVDYLELSDWPSGCREQILGQSVCRSLRLMQRLQRLKTIADCDGLTGFYNHTATPDAFGKLLRNHPEQEFLLAIIDIDYFKQVNDVRGHEFGDRVLIEESRRLEQLLGEQALAARYGGDEFVLLLPAVSPAEAMAETIYHTVRFVLEDYKITCSIGVTTTLSGSREWETLFRQADQALYTAKANGRNQYRVYTPALSCQLDGVGEEVRSKQLNLNASGLIHALANGHSLVCHLDLEQIAVTKLTRIASGEYGWSDPVEYIPFINSLLESVEEPYRLRFSEFINPNTLAGRLEGNGTARYCYAGVDGKQYQAAYYAGDENQSGQITNALLLLGETNSGESAALGEEESAVDRCLASCLNQTYNAIWIIHPANLSRQLVSIQTDISRHRRINRLFEGGNYWEDTKGYVGLYVPEEEREALLKALHPDVLFKEVAQQGMYNVYFHRRVDGVTYYCQYSFVSGLYREEKVLLQLYRRLELVE